MDIRDILKNCTLFQLEEIKSDIDYLIEIKKKQHWADVAEILYNSEDYNLNLCGEALLHKFHNLAPTTEKLGYKIADVFGSISKSPIFHNELALWSYDILDALTTYVFQNTKYDNCDNGYFYRRS